MSFTIQMHPYLNFKGDCEAAFNQVLMAGDVAPDQYQEPKGFSLSLQIESVADAERILHELAKDGRVRHTNKHSGPRGSAWWSIALGSRG